MLVDLAEATPRGSTLTIEINGTPVVVDSLVVEGWSKLIEISRVAHANQLEITLTSSQFVPSETDLESRDNRQLGVAIRNLMLIE